MEISTSTPTKEQNSSQKVNCEQRLMCSFCSILYDFVVLNIVSKRSSYLESTPSYQSTRWLKKKKIGAKYSENVSDRHIISDALCWVVSYRLISFVWLCYFLFIFCVLFSCLFRFSTTEPKNLCVAIHIADCRLNIIIIIIIVVGYKKVCAHKMPECSIAWNLISFHLQNESDTMCEKFFNEKYTTNRE